LRLRGLPFNVQEQQVEEFFRSINFSRRDLQFKYQEDGKFSGDCIMRLHSAQNLNEVKRLNLSRMGHRYIEILDSNEMEYMQA